MTTPESAPQKKLSPLDRMLNVVAEVKAGEGLAALLLVLTLFIILAGYYSLKTAREGLILGDTIYVPFLGELPGTEVKIGASGAMAILMLAIVPAYGALASKVPRKKLLDTSYTLVIASLALFFGMDQIGFDIGLGYFIWLGIVNMFLIAQFWSYANDLYTEEQGKRLFSIIAIGGSAGAVVGPKLKGFTTHVGMMVIAAVLLFFVIVLLNVIERLANQNKPAKEVVAPLAKDGGFQLVLRDRYLLLIGVMMVLANAVNTIGEFVLGSTFAEAANLAVASDVPDRKAAVKDMVGNYYADFFFWVNLVGFLVQTFLASRVIKYAGVRFALYVMPAIAIAGYGTIGLVGGLALIRVAKVAENSTDYSLQNTVRQTLFLPTSREVKYKAKAAIDTFFVRFGDVAASLIVLLSLRQMDPKTTDAPATFAVVNIAIIATWLLVVAGIGHFHRKLEAKGAP